MQIKIVQKESLCSKLRFSSIEYLFSNDTSLMSCHLRQPDENRDKNDTSMFLNH